MDQQKVDMFIMTNGKKFPAEKMPFIREQLLALDDSKWMAISASEFKDPTTSILLSVFGGSLGIDRFYLGYTGMGIGKLLTLGGCGLWALIDIFLITEAAKERNFKELQSYLLY